jgi:hypothetical protein
LTLDLFVQMHHIDGMPLGRIARSVGVSRQTVSRLAEDYDLDVRPSGRPQQTHVDRDWLYEQYVNRCRTLPELAAEHGVSTTTMARWAKIYEIPLRPRGRRPRETVVLP